MVTDDTGDRDSVRTVDMWTQLLLDFEGEGEAPFSFKLQFLCLQSGYDAYLPPGQYKK